MSVPPPLPQTVVARPGWWERHWRWAVPVICVAGMAMFAGAIFALMSVVFGMMRDSEPYRLAMREARGNAEVVRTLGQPIEEGWMVSGSINTAGTRGQAELAIPIEGPKAGGTLYVEAHARNGVWTYDVLLVKVSGRDAVIDLWPELPPAQRGEADTDAADADSAPPAGNDEAAPHDMRLDDTSQGGEVTP